MSRFRWSRAALVLTAIVMLFSVLAACGGDDDDDSGGGSSEFPTPSGAENSPKIAPTKVTLKRRM